MTADRLRDEVNKRLTLNWLIQGAAKHSAMTLHHLVRDELTELHPRLVPLYDQFALVLLLQFWNAPTMALFGRPGRFWGRVATDPAHPFFAHPLLARHGGSLAEASRRRAVERAREKGMSRFPGLFQLRLEYLTVRLVLIEARHKTRLCELARRAAATAWGIPADRLNATLTTDVRFGTRNRTRSVRGHILRAFAASYGGVTHGPDGLEVTARGQNWLLVANELVKGTAELICLHGLNTLDDATYRHVMYHADRIEFEPWMLQSGGELWRRLLAVLPPGRPPAEVLMHLARLPARSLEALMLEVLERPSAARELMAGLGRPAVQPDEP